MVFSSSAYHDETNIKRLLKRCEEMSNQKFEEEVEIDWRLKKYIESLENMLEDLDNKSCKPTDDIMASYRKRLAFLKGIVNVQQVENPLDKMKTYQATPKPTLGSNSNRDIEHSANETINSEVRDELFGKNESVLRKRTGASVLKSDDSTDLDDILKYHHTMQEKIADNMLVLARNIKEQSLIAGNIIRNDSVNVEKSAQLADNNIGHLRIQSDKLQENTRRTSQCWIWILIIIVLVVFINMVLLMKMTKKKT